MRKTLGAEYSSDEGRRGRFVSPIKNRPASLPGGTTGPADVERALHASPAHGRAGSGASPASTNPGSSRPHQAAARRAITNGRQESRARTGISQIAQLPRGSLIVKRPIVRGCGSSVGKKYRFRERRGDERRSVDGRRQRQRLELSRSRPGACALVASGQLLEPFGRYVGASSGPSFGEDAEEVGASTTRAGDAQRGRAPLEVSMARRSPPQR